MAIHLCCVLSYKVKLTCICILQFDGYLTLPSESSYLLVRSFVHVAII